MSPKCCVLQYVAVCCSVLQCVAEQRYNLDQDHSRRRWDWKSLDLHINTEICSYFWLTGTPSTHVKPCLKSWGLPRKRVWYVRGLMWKVIGKFGSRNYFKSNFLRLWMQRCPHICYSAPAMSIWRSENNDTPVVYNILVPIHILFRFLQLFRCAYVAPPPLSLVHAN